MKKSLRLAGGIQQKHISFDFVRERLRNSYSETGRPSIDPELLLRIVLIGYLYGITSERKLVEELRMHLAWRWFHRAELRSGDPASLHVLEKPARTVLVYRARTVSAGGCQKTLVAPLPDYLRCVPMLGPCFGNGCANCGSVEARRSPAVWGCGSLRRHRRNFAGTVTTETRAGRSRSAVTAEISRYHSMTSGQNV